MLMETVFKVGMKVYDQIYEPDVKGEVLDVNLDISPHPITVKFGSCVRYYTAEGCRGRNQIRTLSTSPYTIQGFEQKAPVPTYEEAFKYSKSNGNYYYLPDDLLAPSEEIVNAVEALLNLLFLRDYYNEGWQPDWSTKNSMHFCIRVRNNKISIDSNSDINEFNTVLVFRDYTIRDRFLEEQKELLEIAKPLL